jgi:anti-sigma B factor antagonist
MHFIERQEGDVLILSIKGRLAGPPETDKLNERIQSKITENKTKIVLNLKNIHWMSSLGIGAIMRNLRAVREAGGDLRLTGLSEKIKDIFQITKLIGVIQTFDTDQDAVKSFTS